MNPVFIDLHIHTSEDANNLNFSYDIGTLVEKVRAIAYGCPFLISFTDHNTINKKVYLEAVERQIPVILGVELHIEYDPSREPYHCHMYFDAPVINSEVIDGVNAKLDRLYPNKIITSGRKDVPHLDRIVNEFDWIDFLLLPHGGQSHHTFNKAIPKGARFDTTMERSIYYNHFDGFTARSNDGLEYTQDYFSRLGIKDFVNLVTCSDNYRPSDYPGAKAKDASPFVPTWMLAEPTFAGLRLSLSESSRLVYGDKPKKWSEFIQKVSLHNEFIDIDVELSPGLNVVIGGSSSGKTLLVDCIHKGIEGSFSGSVYTAYGIEDIYIQNPSGILPHYINQNYIVQLVNRTEGRTIDEIGIIRNIFPGDSEIAERINSSLARLKDDLTALVSSVKRFEHALNELKRIPVLPRLLLKKERSVNVFRVLLPDSTQLGSVQYPQHKHEQHLSHLSEIEDFIRKNVFVKHDPDDFQRIRKQLERAYHGSQFEAVVRGVIKDYKDRTDAELREEDAEQQSKSQHWERLLELTTEFSKALADFARTLSRLSEYSFEVKTQEIRAMGHYLFIENKLQIDREILKRALNKYLKSDCRIDAIDRLRPHDLFDKRFSKKSPKIRDYADFAAKVFSDFESMNNTVYRILTRDGRDFESLSAGWKTSVLLDLILGYEGDFAPLIIDQPEDNLATDYINRGLISAIKNIKDKKQIILVSHNATIPMLGDAQTVVVCNNTGEKIKIVSSPLEGKIEGGSIVDHIAEITDGGKPSIKKRIKKYNLKSFKG